MQNETEIDGMIVRIEGQDGHVTKGQFCSCLSTVLELGTVSTAYATMHVPPETLSKIRTWAKAQGVPNR